LSEGAAGVLLVVGVGDSEILGCVADDDGNDTLAKIWPARIPPAGVTFDVEF